MARTVDTAYYGYRLRLSAAPTGAGSTTAQPPNTTFVVGRTYLAIARLSAATHATTYNATAATSTSVTVSGTPFSGTAMVGGYVRIVSGTGAGQERIITARPSTSQLTVGYAWSINPDATSVIAVVGAAGFYTYGNADAECFLAGNAVGVSGVVAFEFIATQTSAPFACLMGSGGVLDLGQVAIYDLTSLGLTDGGA